MGQRIADSGLTPVTPAVTFQSGSGTGRAAIEELEQQARAWAAGDTLTVKAYPHQIAEEMIRRSLL